MPCWNWAASARTSWARAWGLPASTARMSRQMLSDCQGSLNRRYFSALAKAAGMASFVIGLSVNMVHLLGDISETSSGAGKMQGRGDGVAAADAGSMAKADLAEPAKELPARHINAYSSSRAASMIPDVQA